ncbi:MAG: SGNH/GDSL hydrolase family protein [Clostridia bacterium]|nr:SGNH/GDSL hydrolase family protein [Clostridia bacterium]
MERIIFDRYDLKTYMRPLWRGTTTVNESVLFIGAEDTVQLLYDPVEILSVRSCGLDVEYEEGRDYVLEGGKLRRTANSRMAYLPEELYYPAEKTEEIGAMKSRLPDRPWLYFGEKDTFFKNQIFVTYTHGDTWQGFVPEGQAEKFPKTLAKLERGEEITAVFFGDSITTGCNTSHWMDREPHMESWPEMTVSALKAEYPNAKINYVNTAVGGKNTAWAIETCEERVAAYDPDLVILAFGMNDTRLTAEEHTAQLGDLVALVKEKCPRAEVLVIATTLPNEEADRFWAEQHRFEAVYGDTLLKRFPGLPLVRMGSMHKALLARKRFCHMTGNNINHPNDFLARAYAQSLFKAITGKEF